MNSSVSPSYDFDSITKAHANVPGIIMSTVRNTKIALAEWPNEFGWQIVSPGWQKCCFWARTSMSRRDIWLFLLTLFLISRNILPIVMIFSLCRDVIFPFFSGIPVFSNQIDHPRESRRSVEIFLDQYRGVGVFIPRDKFIRIGLFRSESRPTPVTPL